MRVSGCMKNNYIEVHKETSCHSADAKTGDQGLDLRLLPQKVGYANVSKTQLSRSKRKPYHLQMHSG